MAGSITDKARDIETRITSVLAALDIDGLPLVERNLVEKIKRVTTDARLDARDYQYAETRVEQQASATAAKKRYQSLQQYILKASEHNMFSAIEIAQLGAHIEQLMTNME